MKENQLLYCKQLLPFPKEFLQNPQDKILYPIYRKMRGFLINSSVFQNTQHCVVALSGGVDSAMLLHLLSCYQARPENAGFSLSAVHVHHGVRGIDADTDALLAEQLARLHGIECAVVHAPTLKNHDLVSAEDHLRENRLHAIREYASTKKGSCIATAHHQDDQVETILHRLFQGSDLVGLQGVEQQTQDGWIRPLLHISKKELIALAEHRQIPYAKDQTNDQNHIMRNKIRNHLLPWLETQLNPSVRQQLLGLRDSIEEYVQDITDQASKLLTQARIDAGLYRLTPLQEASPPVLKRTMQMAYQFMSGKEFALSREQLRVIADMIQKRTSGKKYALPNRLGVEIQRGVLIFLKQEESL